MSVFPVVTRFAPSPSGELHLGNARTALFNLLLARRQGGRFVLRIEDTDAGRSSEAHLEALVADLRWLGLDWDLGPGLGQSETLWRQSRRTTVYEPCYQRLLAAGSAYPCYCTPLELEVARRTQLAAGRPPRYAGTCRDLDPAALAERAARGQRPALRFAVPAGQLIEFDDLVHGPQRLRSEEIGDFVIRREDGSSAFFFCNAVDDADMGVTQLLRGEDHLSNTPRQLLLLAALDMRVPRYGHVSLLTGADGTPLSKRHGATTLRELREQGYGAPAVLNLLYRLGHSTPDNSLLTLAQMAAGFDVAHLQRASAHFDPVQLRHWQREWLHSLPAEAAQSWLAQWLPAPLPAAELQRFAAAVLPNVQLAEDVRDWHGVFYGERMVIDAESREALTQAGTAFFTAAAGAVSGDGVTADALRAATGAKGAAFFRPLRAALTGRLHGPELAPLLAALGPARVRARLLAQVRGTERA